MSLIELQTNPLLLNLVLFSLAAGGVWLCGSRLSYYVDQLAERTGIGKAFAGALLLGGATSLPELATTLSASFSGAAEMAGNNLLGGVVMQIAVLAVLDVIFLRNKPLTLFSPEATLLVQGVFLILMLSFSIITLVTGELLVVWGVGLWPVLLFLAYLFCLGVFHRYEGAPRWEPTGEDKQPIESPRDVKDALPEYRDLSSRQLVIRFVLAAGGVLVSGFVVARTGEVLAAQSGLGQSLIGATLVALATSLPEVSTTWTAVRFGAYSMAVANILGTNLLEVALFLPADLAYRDGAIIDSLDPSASFLAALGIICTGLYLWGILERRDKTILGMGYDSAMILLVYVGGMGLYYYVL
ncbi:putative calcium/sodium:proton antiporter [Gimesia chilikensis]|uniref:Putative calcium/sodium:proton antiporter n=1 Tax=Gimesia chilikensis TaxID=2605989 RepID=A0A517WH03_9PLAN|nr:sodium:calcium antiporter [Gimesia chilikensis]QDU04541.1 putative calcium/sodium:proton antiporter [Gimesia chilikensis]